MTRLQSCIGKVGRVKLGDNNGKTKQKGKGLDMTEGLQIKKQADLITLSLQSDNSKAIIFA